jgi:arabinofuranan 3-O-arabinosyltransferase
LRATPANRLVVGRLLLGRSLWVLGSGLLAGRLLLASLYGGGDFLPVWSAVRAFFNHQPPYTVDLFVYPPGALILCSPLGWIGFGAAKLTLLVLNAGAILVAAALCLRLFGVSWRSTTGAAVLIGLGLFAPVTQTLYASNVNGLIVAAEAAALAAAAEERWLLAGTFLGLACTIKPILAPLALLLLIARQWRAMAVMVGIPALLSGLALLLMVDGKLFFTGTLPFLLSGEGQSSGENVSLLGTAAAFDVSAWVANLLRLLVLLGAALVVWSSRRPPFELGRWLVEMASLILLAVILDFAFAWSYYGLYLLPLMISIVRPPSAMHSWPALVALYGVGGPDLGLWLRGGELGFELLHLRFTVGFLLLLVVVGYDLVTREGRIQRTELRPIV